MMPETITIKMIHMLINGQDREIEVRPNELLADVLRERLNLTGTKVGCEAGDCGACTVLINGKPTLSCLTLAIECEGKEILTIEGLGDAEKGELHPLQKAFVEHYGVQCGFCTPAMILTAKALLDKNPSPADGEIREAINGVICRCTGYMQIVESISAAAKEMKGTVHE
jgi:aerobic-type carbon monoxide dehydrogenase small subunit (CoxS/CutS family)